MKCPRCQQENPSQANFCPDCGMPLKRTNGTDLAVGGLPVGVQIMGQQHADARMTAMARWMLSTITPVCV